MGRWGAIASLLLNHITRKASSNSMSPHIFAYKTLRQLYHPLEKQQKSVYLLGFTFRSYSSAIPSRVYPNYNNNEIGYYGSNDLASIFDFGPKEDDDIAKIPVKAYFLCTCIDLKSMQSENIFNVVPPTSRSTNYIVLRYCDFPTEITALGVQEYMKCQYMVVFHYGSAVLFNIEDHEVESFLEIVRRHASGLLPEMRKDDYAIKEKPLLVEDMQGGPDCIVLKTLDTDSIRIMGSVLGQSIALDYFVSQVDGMVEEFAGINRAMEKTGTFTMDRKKLIQLVGKANSNLADVILKVGLFERSEIAWRDAKYAQIYEYLREEYEVTQRFGNLDFKLKFVEHNIHFLQEVIQNRRSDLLEWCIIFLLSVENIISIYEIVMG